MYVKAKYNGIPVYENEQPGVDYIIKKGDEASLREQIAFAMTGIEHYIIPAFDKVVDLKTCVDYLELYGFDELEISRKTECNGDVFILPAKYPDVESYSAKVQNDLQEAKRRVMQRVSEKKMTEKEGKERLLRCEGRYNDDIKQYEKFFSDEITKNEKEVLGNFIIKGTYKEYELSLNKKDFSFTLPFSVEIASNIDINTLDFTVDNFTYDLKDKDLTVKIDYIVKADEKKEEPTFEKTDRLPEPLDLIDERNDAMKMPEIKEEPIKTDDKINDNMITTVTGINAENDYISYHIHIVKETEDIDFICKKYNISKEELLNINGITDININDKLLVPITNE